jgi:hypothetical protein
MGHPMSDPLNTGERETFRHSNVGMNGSDDQQFVDQLVDRASPMWTDYTSARQPRR